MGQRGTADALLLAEVPAYAVTEDRKQYRDNRKQVVRREDQTDEENRNHNAGGAVPIVSHTNRLPPFVTCGVEARGKGTP